MTFDDIWNQLLAKKPALRDDAAQVTFTADNFKRLLRQVYEQGQKSKTAASVAKMFESFSSFTRKDAP